MKKGLTCAEANVQFRTALRGECTTPSLNTFGIRNNALEDKWSEKERVRAASRTLCQQ